VPGFRSSGKALGSTDKLVDSRAELGGKSILG
jgi:hypothetical protein